MSELEIWNELGNIYFNTGAFDEAIRTYQKAIELGHGCGQSYSNLASIYTHQGHYAEAIPLLQKGIDLLTEANSKAFLWNQLGEAYRNLEDYSNATAAHRKAAELDPENTAFQDNLAEVELASRQLNTHSSRGTSRIETGLAGNSLQAESDAVPEIHSSLIDSTVSPESGTACWVFKDNQPQIDNKENASESPESSPMILGNRVLSEASTEEIHASDQDITDRQTIALADENPQSVDPEAGQSKNARAHALLRLGIIHWHNREYERAIQFLEMALEKVVRPKDNFLEALCHNAIALVDTDLGKTVEAIQAYQSAASLAPERIFPWNSLGNLNCMLEHYEDAMAAFREGIEHNPKDAISWNGLGDVYHKLGRFEDAISAYQLGNVFENQTLDEDVIKAYEMTIEADQENPQVWNEAGAIYIETGAYEDAIASFHKAIELDADNATFQANLEKAEQALGQGNHMTEPSRLETQPEIHLENNPQSDSSDAITASPAGEEINTVPSESTGSEETHEREDETAAEESSCAGDKTSEVAPEAAYFVFKTEPSLGKGLHPAERYSPVGAETVMNSAKSMPAYSTHPQIEQAFPAGQGLGNPETDASALFIQLPPRAMKPGSTEDRIRPSYGKNDWQFTSSENHADGREPSGFTPEIRTNDPIRQVNAKGNSVIDKAPIDLHILERDIAAYRRITDLNPLNDRAWDALGNMYETAGLHSEAIKAFEQAIALSPEKEAYHYHLGIALGYQMHYDKAIQAFEDVIALNPNYVLAHCALGAYYHKVGKEADAQEHIAIARPSMEAENEYNRACFESISGNTDRAFELLETALEKQQVQTAMLRSDPDLDFIRNDARFEALLNQVVTV